MEENRPEDPTADEARALMGEIEAELAGIAHALERLESGRYWSCELCGAEISAERLAAEPTAARCDRHPG
ncbi:MAG: hypothetical protein JWM85_1602 [Acidimicrobiaceae bacterium]|nr:hypothetical protein [Acidimicrobiaceae bacterium]